MSPDEPSKMKLARFVPRLQSVIDGEMNWWLIVFIYLFDCWEIVKQLKENDKKQAGIEVIDVMD